MEKVHIRKLINKRLPSPQAAAGEGALMHATASGSAGLRSRQGTALYLLSNQQYFSGYLINNAFKDWQRT